MLSRHLANESRDVSVSPATAHRSAFPLPCRSRRHRQLKRVTLPPGVLHNVLDSGGGRRQLIRSRVLKARTDLEITTK